MSDDLFLPESPKKSGPPSAAVPSQGDQAISRKQIEGQVTLSPKELSNELFSVSLLIQQSKDLHQKLGHLCDSLVNFCGFSFASVILLTETKNSLRIRLGHIKTLSNTAGLKARDFFESVARPGTELIREYYDSIFQDQYEIINTFCVPPDVTYPILQASGISDPKVASNLIRFCVVPQVIDDSLHRKIIPPLQKNGSQKAKSFISEDEPLQIFAAIYNGTIPADNDDIYGVYIPIRDSSKKVLGILSLGPRITQAQVSQEDSLAYHCAFEPLISHLALELENEALRQLVSGSQGKAESFKPSDFLKFLSGLEELENPQDKFDFICQHVLKHTKAEFVFGVLFNGSLVIEKTSLATRIPQLESEISEFYLSNFSPGNNIRAEFLGALFLPEYQTSSSYLVTDEQLSGIELYSKAIFGFRKGFSREKLTGESTLFTPITNKSGLITGYVAAALDPRPTDPAEVAEIAEFYTQFVGNDALASPNKTAVSDVGYRSQFASVFDLADSLHYHSTLEEKAQVIARGVLRIGGLSAATVVFYDEQEHIAYQQTYPADENEPAPPARPAALCKSGGIEKFASDAIFMTPGFKYHNGYCFNADQVTEILNELERGNEPPMEFSSPFIGEENFAGFLNDTNTGIFIPMKSGRYTFGYVGLGDPLPDATPDSFKDRLSLLTIFVNKAATHLWQLHLEEQTAKQSRGKASLRELLSSLLATNEQIQSGSSIEEKVEKVIDAVVELFGLTYAAVAMYDKSYRIRYSSCKFHPQSVHAGIKKNFANRFNPGRQASEHVLKTIFSEAFSAGPCAIFKANQLRDAIRKKPLSYSQKSITVLNDEPVRVTSLSLDNISDYLNGDHRVGLMMPLYGEQGRLVGTVSLGGTLFAGDIVDATEFIERIKIIAHFTAQVFRDYQLSLAEAQREEESRKLRKKNVFIQTLLELNVTLAQPIPKHEKCVAICERSAANSDFSFVGTLLLNGNDLLITDYYLTINNRQAGQPENAGEQKLIGNQYLNKDFLSRALTEENRVSNSYCFDFRQIAKEIGTTSTLVIQGKELLPITEPINTEGTLTQKDAFEVFYNARKNDSAPVTFLTPIYTSGGDLLGLIVIGKVLPGIKKSSVEVVGDIVLIELVAKSLARNLENTLLTEKLSRWDAKFRNLVENVQHGFILFDSTGKIEFVNGFIRQILGYQSEEMLGKTLEEFVPTENTSQAEYHQRLVQKTLREGYIFPNKTTTDYELTITSKEGVEIPFMVTTTPEMILSAAGDLFGEGSFSLLVDLRHKREIERKQKELATMRNNFFAMVVHDMKVPLSTIYGYSDMLNSMNPQQVDGEYFQKIVSRIHLSANNINTLVQEILDFSKYESGMIKIDSQFHSLVLCTDLVIEQNKHELNKKKILIRREIGNSDFYFRFDFDKLVRVINNILSNAIKFSAEHSTIDITVVREIVDLSPFAKVTIKDYGEGISPDEIELIFDPYRQAKSKLGPIGTGLGLSIARHIIQLHGGQISAESELGVGTAFTFTLPMSNVKDDVSSNSEFS